MNKHFIQIRGGGVKVIANKLRSFLGFKKTFMFLDEKSTTIW